MKIGILLTLSTVLLAGAAAQAQILESTNFGPLNVGDKVYYKLDGDCTISGTTTNSMPAVATISPATFTNFPPAQTPPDASDAFTIAALSPGSTVIVANFTETVCGDLPGGDMVKLTIGVIVVGSPPAQAVPTSGNTLNTGSAGEPVSTATGELYGYDADPDLSISGPMPLVFQRYYGAFLAGSGVKTALGTSWMSNFDISLTVSGGTATVTLFRGKTVKFNQSGAAWTLSSNEQRPYQMTAAGGGYQFLDLPSNLIYGFNSSGALIRIQDRNGNALTVTPGTNGPTLIADGQGRSLTLSYTGANLTKIQDQAGRSVTYAYSNGNLSAYTDANGKQTTFAYSSAGGVSGLMTSSTRPAGNQPLTQQFDSSGRVSAQTDSAGATMTLTYASGGATFSTPGGPSLTDVYDSSYNLISRTDSSGIGSKTTYDASNRPLTSTDRTGASESVTYDPASGLPSTHIDKGGNKTSYEYTATAANGFTYYDLTQVSFPDGTTLNYMLDGNGNVLAITDQAGNQWQFTYNTQGQVTAATNPANGVTKSAYGADGTMSQVQLPSGNTTSYSYDAAKRPVQIANPDQTAQSTSYDALNLTGATDENGHATAFAYDGNNNLKSTTDATNAVVTAAYDGDDRISSVTDALGQTALRAYDQAGRLKSQTDASGVATNYVYDSLNRPTQILDTAGQGFTLEWDQEARLTGITDALSRTTTLTLDPRGLVTGIKTPLGETTSIALDSMGRTASTTDALGRVTSYKYDPRGLTANVTLPGGVSSNYTYNALGEPIGQTDPNGNSWSRAYDAQGRLTGQTDPLGQTASFQYNSRQWVSGVTLPLGSVQNSYDAAGNVTARAWSDGTSLTFTYDADNRLTGGTGFSLAYDANGRISTCNGLQIGRDAAGRIASVTYAAGKVVRYVYDNRGLLVQVTDWVGGNTAFTRDAAHQLTSRTFPNGAAENYTYDADGRVATMQVAKGSTPISSIGLSRDALGRVTGATRTAASVADVPSGYFGQEFDAAAQSLNGTYDANGRETQDAFSGRSYAWDLASRLASYDGPNGTAAFTYDALGQRISRTESGVTHSYVIDYALGLPSIATVQSGGTDVRYYVWTPGGRLLYSIEAADNTRHFYHFDESGTASFLTDDTGAVTDSYASTPYGETVVQTGSTPNPFTFQGEFGVMQEGGTGLYYMRARYYDSTAARFLSRDPLAQTDPRAASPYQFAYANPVEGRDPSGMDSPGAATGPTGGGPGPSPKPPVQTPAITTPAGPGRDWLDRATGGKLDLNHLLRAAATISSYVLNYVPFSPFKFIHTDDNHVDIRAQGLTGTYLRDAPGGRWVNAATGQALDVNDLLQRLAIISAGFQADDPGRPFGFTYTDDNHIDIRAQGLTSTYFWDAPGGGWVNAATGQALDVNDLLRRLAIISEQFQTHVTNSPFGFSYTDDNHIDIRAQGLTGTYFWEGAPPH